MRRHPLVLVLVVVAVALTAGTSVPLERAGAEQSGFVHAAWTDGRGVILDGDGRPLYLRGVQLECWLLGGGPCWGGGPTAETPTYQNLAQLVGLPAADRFRSDLYATYVTDADIARAAALGFNTVRVAINPAALDFGDAGWKALDGVVASAQSHGLYVILDLHAAPSPQSSAGNADYSGKGPTLWQKGGKKAATVDLWRQIAERYHDRHAIAAYDLLNEPDTGGHSAQLVSLIKDIAHAIRDADPNHMLIVEGDGSGANPTVFNGPVDSNQAYAFHTYNQTGQTATQSQIQYMRSVSRSQHVPILNGEFGQNSVSWVRQTRAQFENPSNDVNGWIYWSWKAPGWQFGKGTGQLIEQWQPTPAWQRTIAWASHAPVPMNESGTSLRPSPAEARRGMQDFLEIVRLERTREPIPLLQALGLTP